MRFGVDLWKLESWREMLWLLLKGRRRRRKRNTVVVVGVDADVALLLFSRVIGMGSCVFVAAVVEDGDED